MSLLLRFRGILKIRNRRAAVSTLEAEPAADPDWPIEVAVVSGLHKVNNVFPVDVQKVPAVALAGMVSFLPACLGLDEMDVTVSLGADVIVLLGLLAKVYLGLGGLFSGLLLLRLLG